MHLTQKLCVILLSGLALASVSQAALVQSDFLTAGDKLLVTDTATDLQWLSPLYTRSHLYNDSFVQGVISTYGFRYATATETLDMVHANFGYPPTTFPGDAAGFTAAGAFMDTFGVAAYVTCGSPVVPCPRTQGLTATPTTSGSDPAHIGIGMIQLGSAGWLIDNNPWRDDIADSQMGSWLVRASAESQTPEPQAVALAAAGLLLCFQLRKR